MRALCVDSQRNLEVRDIPQPQHPPANHVLIRMDACTINSGDKTFLRTPSMGRPLQKTGYVSISIFFGHSQECDHGRLADRYYPSAGGLPGMSQTPLITCAGKIKTP
jgi:hypothetical protein